MSEGRSPGAAEREVNRRQPTLQEKQRHADYLESRGVPRAVARAAARVADAAATSQQVVEALVAWCRSLPRRNG